MVLVSQAFSDFLHLFGSRGLHFDILLLIFIQDVQEIRADNCKLRTMAQNNNNGIHKIGPEML
jgi:hypothetical protein